ncbi:hypothetical protein OIDMADRAFT_166737 [Oidiodendron maius Zn]|uniref:Methylated-DNA--protein-cysteine methyltransferase n=1 Tax=Oidiodendron maius (strain Zn) TaxID=913774 RepID=A0A0C3GT01_OIDMZ|nr:hypothetical protein OIDMADRAFT_166737 [Oidiodendron maius Zn]
MSGVTEFQEKVYALLRQIQRGKVTTYVSIARALNTSPRAVGNVLRNNPFAPEVPCHRCVGSTGFITGFDGESIDKKTGTKMGLKISILNDEGVNIDEKGMIMNCREVQWDGPWKV